MVRNRILNAIKLGRSRRRQLPKIGTALNFLLLNRGRPGISDSSTQA